MQTLSQSVPIFNSTGVGKNAAWKCEGKEAVLANSTGLYTRAPQLTAPVRSKQAVYFPRVLNLLVCKKLRERAVFCINTP
jgi:hypothetical protein